MQQLGLANHVFPSADYSRFAHAIEAHAEALAKQALPATPGALSSPPKFEYVNHEAVGKLILEHDPELQPLVQALPGVNGEPAHQIAAMFEDELDTKYGTLVSSELDADRLDYLMRSSQSTSLPYGRFDHDYIIQNLAVDGQGKVCLLPKAIRAANHFVLCRSFDYLQVIFHKTVVGFEEMLKRCIRYLFEHERLKLGKGDIVAAIQNERWYEFDDAYLLRLIGKIPKTAPPNVQTMRNRLVRRQRARLLWAHEELIASKKTTLEDEWYQRLGHHLDFEDGWKANRIYWFKYFRPTNASPFASTYVREKKDDEKKEKSIHILTKSNKGSRSRNGGRALPATSPIRVT